MLYMIILTLSKKIHWIIQSLWSFLGVGNSLVFLDRHC